MTPADGLLGDEAGAWAGGGGGGGKDYGGLVSLTRLVGKAALTQHLGREAEEPLQDLQR